MLGYQKQNLQVPSKTFSTGDLLFQNVALVSKKANKVLNICQNGKFKGMLILYEDLNQQNQRFDIVKYGDSVNIINKGTRKCLTVSCNSQKNGAPIFQQQHSDLLGQRFRLAKVSDNQYLIHTFCGKILDCCQEKTSNGTPIIQFQCKRTQHQRWHIRQNKN